MKLSEAEHSTWSAWRWSCQNFWHAQCRLHHRWCTSVSTEELAEELSHLHSYLIPTQ